MTKDKIKEDEIFNRVMEAFKIDNPNLSFSSTAVKKIINDVKEQATADFIKIIDMRIKISRESIDSYDDDYVILEELKQMLVEK